MGAALEAKRGGRRLHGRARLLGRGRGRRRAVPQSYVETAPNLTVATYFASKQYIAENGEVVERFKRAMEKSLEYAATNDDEVRAWSASTRRSPPR